MIAAGLVTVDGEPAEKPSQIVFEPTQIEVTGNVMPYVGRG